MAAVINHQFTVQDYGRMTETGIIDENDAVELIRGEIVKKMPIGQQHAVVVNRLNQWLVGHCRDVDRQFDLIDSCVEAYREPPPNGNYRVCQIFYGEDVAPILSFPELTLAVAEIL